MEIISLLSAVLSFGYLVYALIRIFDQPLWPGVGRGLLVLLLSQLFYALAVALLAGFAWIFIL